jgi:hypothetical protein
MLLFLFSTLIVTQAVVPYDSSKLLSIIESTQTVREHRLAKHSPSIPTSAYQEASSVIVAKGLFGQIGWGIGIFQIEIQELYAALNEEESHTGLSPVDYTKIIQGVACSNERQVMMHLPIPMLSDRWWVTVQGTNPKIRQISNGQMAELTWNALSDHNTFTLDETSQTYTTDAVWVTESTGAWLLIRLDDKHTLGEYHAWSHPGGYVPAGLASSLSASGIADTFKAMEEFAVKNTELCTFTWP